MCLRKAENRIGHVEVQLSVLHLHSETKARTCERGLFQNKCNNDFWVLQIHCAFLEKGFSAKHCYPAAVHVEAQVRACAVRVPEQLPVSLFLGLHSEGAVLANPLSSAPSMCIRSCFPVISAGHSIN